MALVVTSQSIEQQPMAEALAQRLALPYVSQPEAGVALCVTTEGIVLQQFGAGAPGPVCVDFVGGAMGHRRQFGGGRGQLVAKAVGVKKDRIPVVVDATAGLGRDSFILAQLGCQVTMLERSAIVATLLQDGLNRAAEEEELSDTIARMKLVQGDAIQWLLALGSDQQPDVVYVDPMHPERSKSALVKKEMRMFRDLVGSDSDDADLLAAAIKAAKRRVVVKRPRKAEAIAGPKPSLVMSGKSTRYDIYLKPQ